MASDLVGRRIDCCGGRRRVSLDAPTLRRFVLCRQFSSSLSYEGPPNESVANLTTIFSVTNRRWYNWRWPRTWLGDALIATAVADGVSLDAPMLRRFVVLLSPILIFAELRRSAE